MAAHGELPLAAGDAGVTRRADAAPARMAGRRLLLARVAWVAVALPSVGLFVASLAPDYWQLVAYTEQHMGDPEALRVGLAELGLSIEAYARYSLALKTLLALGYVATGAVVFWRRATERMAILFSLFLVTFGVVFPNTLDALEAPYPAVRLALKLLEALSFAGFFVLCYVFPDSRFVPRWTRWLAPVWLAVMLPNSLLPGSPLDPGSWPAPIGTPLWVALFATCPLAQLYRYRRVSGPAARQQTKWVVFGFTVAVTSFVAVSLPLELVPALQRPGAPAALYNLFANTAYVGCFLLVPLAVGVAILRHRLWDIDIIINRALVYGALTACVVGLYTLLVGGLGALFQLRGSPVVSIVATGVVAVLFQPLRARLQRGVNRLLYGERDEPYAVLSRLGQRLEGTLAPDAVLPAVVETVAQALKLPYAAIALERAGQFAVVAARGAPPAAPVRLPLVYQGEVVGEMLLATRAPGEDFTPADRRLLDDLARQAGIAAHAVRLTADLQRSRERLVTAREEERRRLRRDLHDGLGPALAAMTMQAEAARDLLAAAPEQTDALLADLTTQLQEATADIRRLVYELRPPALDDLGLVPALRAHAARVEQGGPRIAVDAPDQLPPPPAAVEVAAYRIAQEALTNVVRHARARTCTVRLTLDDASPALCLEIADDGVGLPETRTPGVGLASMRERAEELGGACLIENGPTGGARVLACLPLGEASGGRD